MLSPHPRHLPHPPSDAYILYLHVLCSSGKEVQVTASSWWWFSSCFISFIITANKSHCIGFFFFKIYFAWISTINVCLGKRNLYLTGGILLSMDIFFGIFNSLEWFGSCWILCLQLEETDSWEESIDSIISNFESKHRRKLLYSVSFYWLMMSSLSIKIERTWIWLILPLHVERLLLELYAAEPIWVNLLFPQYI